jgi:hypothetical protein
MPSRCAGGRDHSKYPLCISAVHLRAKTVRTPGHRITHSANLARAGSRVLGAHRLVRPLTAGKGLSRPDYGVLDAGLSRLSAEDAGSVLAIRSRSSRVWSSMVSA